MDVAKKHEISDQTIYLWRKKFGQVEPADVRKLRQLEQENAKLKKLVAERDLEIELMKEVAAKNGRRASPVSTGGISVPRPAPRRSLASEPRRSCLRTEAPLHLDACPFEPGSLGVVLVDQKG